MTHNGDHVIAYVHLPGENIAHVLLRREGELHHPYVTAQVYSIEALRENGRRDERFLGHYHATFETAIADFAERVGFAPPTVTR